MIKLVTRPRAAFVSISLTIAVRVFAANDEEARTIFQTGDPYSTAVDIRSDAAVVYGVNDSFTSRVAEWKRQGYRTQMMTGVSWGGYNHYIDGSFDGSKHEDEGQVDPEGNVIWHHPGVPYMVPTSSYIKFLKTLTRAAIDAGVEAIHLEEPEFWSRAGYSKGFKRLWQEEYKEAWRRPDSSPDAFWRSSKLKYALYKRTLDELFSDAKSYATEKGQTVGCYVPTHSLINYSQWGIVSPESSLMDLEKCDGYIAQVWTGTARTPNHYRGVNGERTFETAFLEYSSMYYMVAPTGRTVYFLADPVEDDPKHTWDDYRANYEKVVAASLMFPDVHHFEVMPWPDRVFTYKYPSGTYSSEPAVTIPTDYATELMTVVNALNDMKQTEVQWSSGSTDVGVMVSDTMMFQRGNNWGENGPIQFNAFYGMALPLIKSGIPARCLVLERCMQPGALEQVKVLILSYEAMKPLKPEYHDRIANWVKAGGRLVYIGDDSDPFHAARDWWNADGKTSATARQDLFTKLELDAESDGQDSFWKVGEGAVSWHRVHPAKLAMDPKGPETVMALASGEDTNNESPLVKSHIMSLRRGPYLVGNVINEAVGERPLKLTGLWADLFTSNTAVVKDPEFQPGQVFFLRSLNEPLPAGSTPETAVVIATTARVEATTRTESAVQYELRGPSGISNHQILVGAKEKPKALTINQEVSNDWQWEPETGLLRIKIPFRQAGMDLEIKW